MAIGHVRYSTTGSPKPQNVQPLVIEYSKGLVAVAHNGTLTNASATLAAANTNLVAVVAQLNQPLQNLANVMSNLNVQVQANTNFVSEVSKLVVDLDGLIEGFKRHWFLRGAFKQKPTNAPPAKATAPKSRRR